MSRLLLILFIVSGGIVPLAVWRLLAIYRRRQRWKLLMTSHHSLRIARERIVAAPPPLNED